MPLVVAVICAPRTGKASWIFFRVSRILALEDEGPMLSSCSKPLIESVTWTELSATRLSNLGTARAWRSLSQVTRSRIALVTAGEILDRSVMTSNAFLSVERQV